MIEMNSPAPTSLPTAANAWANLDPRWRTCVYAFGITIVVGAGAAIVASFVTSATRSASAATSTPVVTESPLKVLTKPQELYDMELKAMEARYPELNQASPDFHKELYTEIMKQMKIFEKQGLSPSRALLRSADLIMGKHRADQILNTNRAARQKKQSESHENATPSGADMDKTSKASI